ncbi:iron chelate uptake ABC transporter family permease subunit [Marinilactibacillus kalidii]|uniref:iron chelate uptake ABC transporter family permease subunit n=1 Tax=Marinilactibacillus kalidii TaxID=2820274 RepID=UPI001ABDC18D|nr:iron chelate uptake ABC transporter family permease subunit [Marinilactibacillus kalidii]
MTKNRLVYRKVLIMGGIMIVLMFLYMTIGSRGNWSYIVSLRGKKIVALILVSICSTVATIVFHTISQNRILTPTIIGMDTLYIFFQTIVLFSLSHFHAIAQNKYWNFFLSGMAMMLFSLVLYGLFFKLYPGRIYLLLMTGLILGTCLRSLTTFLQVLMEPNEFLLLQSRLFASFNRVEVGLVGISIGIVIPTILYIFLHRRSLDVLHLGRAQAIALGLGVDRFNLKLFIMISLLTAVSTALVGPVMFLGFLGANVSYKIFETYEHSILFLGGCFFTISFVLLGQMMIEHVFHFQTTLSVVLEFVGGSYFLYVLLKEREVIK